MDARWPWWQLLLAALTSVITLYFAGTITQLAASQVSYDYDEGVYWQTLRAVDAGGTLYANVFFSQPPLFASYAEAIYRAAGETLLAARLSVGLMGLAGLAGAAAIGGAITGRTGALIAMLAFVSSWTVLRANLVFQADGPSIMLHLLALAAALLWWRTPRLSLAIACGALVAASIAMKLLGVTVLVPVTLVGIMALAEVRSDRTLLTRRVRDLAVALLAALLVVTASVLPHLSDWDEMVRQVVTFHLHAQAIDDHGSLSTINTRLLPLWAFVRDNSGLCLAAALGAVAGLKLRPRLSFILLAYLGAGIALVALQTPIFPHHYVILVPPVIALAACSLLPFRGRSLPAPAWLVALAMLTGLLATIENTGAFARRSVSDALVAEIRDKVAPGQLIITDDQFSAALADRSTPPGLVDTSRVRLQSGYLTGGELCAAAVDPAVAAVYMGTGRLERSAEFRGCVAELYTLAKSFGDARALWVRNP